jgi:tripeptide aminopeptidase
VGELQDETFTGAEATVTIHGVDVHPGFATGKLVNAARLAGELLAALPADLTPEATSGRQGFIHVFDVSATAGRAVVRAIVRDFDEDLLERHIALLRATAEEVVGSEPRARLEVDVRRQYPNMRSHIEPFPEVIEAAERAIRGEGIEPLRTPIRGGTDGSLLSSMGLPTPNLFTGGHEYHSVREWASVQDMAAAAATIVRLAGEWAKR